MDPLTLLILSFLMSWAAIKTVPEVVADTIATIRASKAGKWDLIEKDRARKADVRQRRASARGRWAEAWAERRQLRHERAGGVGQYRPGFRDYVRDCNHAYWEKQLAKNANLRPLEDGEKPTLRHRLFDATYEKARRDSKPAVLVDQYGVPFDNQDPTPHLTPGFVPESVPARASVAPVIPIRPPSVQSPASDISKFQPESHNTNDRLLAALGTLHGRPDRQYDGSAADLYQLWLDQSYGPRQQRLAAEAGVPYLDWVPSAEDEAEKASKHRDLFGTPGPTESPVQAPTGAVDEGNTEMTAAHADMMTNDDARANFAEMEAGAADLNEAIAMAEAAKARIAAAQAASADAMSGTAFDSGAVAATADIGDALGIGGLTEMAEAADIAHSQARAGHAHLDKYRDAEDLVAQTGVDTSTLASSSS